MQGRSTRRCWGGISAVFLVLVVFDLFEKCAPFRCLNRPPPPLFPTLKFIKGDISSSDLISYVLADEGIDTIMHFAAQVRVTKRVIIPAPSNTPRAAPPPLA